MATIHPLLRPDRPIIWTPASRRGTATLPIQDIQATELRIRILLNQPIQHLLQPQTKSHNSPYSPIRCLHREGTANGSE